MGCKETAPGQGTGPRYEVHTARGFEKRGDAESADFVRTIVHDPCAYCLRRSRPNAIDHIVATSKGGDDHWTNLASVCNGCNSRKKNASSLTALMRRNGYVARVVGWAE